MDSFKWKYIYIIILVVICAIETVVFIVAYGWHLSAINQYEKDCDRLAGWVIEIGILIFRINAAGTLAH